MDPLMEAYRKVQKESKDMLNEQSGQRFQHDLNHALLEFYNIKKELIAYNVDAEILDGMFESMKKVVDDWKTLINKRTAV